MVDTIEDCDIFYIIITEMYLFLRDDNIRVYRMKIC